MLIIYVILMNGYSNLQHAASVLTCMPHLLWITVVKN